MNILKKVPAILGVMILVSMWAAVCNILNSIPPEPNSNNGNDLGFLFAGVAFLGYLVATLFVFVQRFLGFKDSDDRKKANIYAFVTYIFIQMFFAFTNGRPFYWPKFWSLDDLIFSLTMLLIPILFILDAVLHLKEDFPSLEERFISKTP